MAAQGTERCRHRLTRWMMMGTEAAKRAHSSQGELKDMAGQG
ncbi:hypothetical protein [Akkermansia muciniphila]|nr:hypothetical protein [Akkermansia muciniphila]